MGKYQFNHPHPRPLFDPRAALGLGHFAHAFAFNTDPGGSDDGNGDPPGDPTPGVSMTQEEFDRTIQQRLERDRAARENERVKRLQALGFSSFDEMEQALGERAKAEAQRKAEAEEAERARLEKEQRFGELLDLERKKREEEAAALQGQVAQLQQERDGLVTSQRNAEKQRALVAAASTAVSPEQVAMLLSGRVTHSEDGKLVVLGDDGQPRTDGKGGDFTVSMLVEEWLGANPHFQRAAGGRGAASTPPGTPSGGEGYEGLPEHRRGDVAYMQKYQTQIMADMKAGKIPT